MHGATYICEDCGAVFDHPKKTHNGGYWEEEWYECPSCGGTNYDPAIKCIVCDKLHKSDVMEDGICPKCLDNAINESAADYIRQDISLVSDFARWLSSKETK